MRATAKGRSYSVLPLRSSIDSPQMPASAASATLAPTPSASSEKPASKSAFTGRSVATHNARTFCRVSSRDSDRSWRPMEADRPALVVAIALKPSFSSWRTSPTFQALGMIKNSECKERKCARIDFRSFMDSSDRYAILRAWLRSYDSARIEVVYLEFRI